MVSVSFYHLTATPLERALPKLLEKMHAAGHKALVTCASDDRMDQLNQLLWTYDPASFLPHGSTKDGDTHKQPILLSTTTDRQNHASLLLITDGREAENIEEFDRVVDIFNGNDDQALETARQRWTNYRNLGYILTYLQQTSDGKWSDKKDK